MVNAILFVAFSMLCGVASSLVEMIVFRAAQGFTGGVMIPMAFTIVNIKLPPDEAAVRPDAVRHHGDAGRRRSGPTIGGWLTDNYGWPYIFYINLVPGMHADGAVWWAWTRSRCASSA